jgi:hypothetical protein
MHNGFTEMHNGFTEMRNGFTEMHNGFTEMRNGLGTVAEEMRAGFDKLILANEVTRDLAHKAGHLAIQTSQRLSNLERRFTDLESNP